MQLLIQKQQKFENNFPGLEVFFFSGDEKRSVIIRTLPTFQPIVCPSDFNQKDGIDTLIMSGHLVEWILMIQKFQIRI